MGIRNFWIGWCLILGGCTPSVIPPPGGDSSPTARPRSVICLGKIEPAGRIFRVALPSGSADCRVESLAVAEGQRVAKGQLLARLDNAPLLAAEVRQAEREVSEAEASLADALAGPKEADLEVQRAELDRLSWDASTRLQAQQAQVERLRLERDLAKAEWLRYRELWLGRALSESEYQSRLGNLQQAEQSFAQAQAQWQQLKGTGQEQVRAARAQLRALRELRPSQAEVRRAGLAKARAALQVAQERLARSQILAPCTGVILEIFTKEGEKPNGDCLLELADTDKMCAVAEVYQTEISRVRVGQMATIQSEVLGQELLHGRVEQLGRRIQRQSVINSDPSSNLDERVLEARIRLDRASSRKVAGLTNLQVKVTLP